MPPDYATRTPSGSERFETEKERFWEDLEAPPPGERPLVVQVLGWALILQGIALFIVLLREGVGTAWFSPTNAWLATGAVACVAVGILVDRARPWGFHLGVPVSAIGAGWLGWLYLSWRAPLVGVGALWDVAVLVGLWVARGHFFSRGGAGG